jgi:ABC-type transporter MlaC component
MDPVKRSQTLEQVEQDILNMMSCAGQVLMNHVRGLSDEKLQQFVASFDEKHRTMLIAELTNALNRPES